MSKKKSRAAEQDRATQRAARAAAVRRERQRAEARRRGITIGAIVIAIALIAGVGFYINSQRDTTGTVASEPAGATADFGLVVGEETAPVDVVIYEDFLCPACGVVEQAINADLTALVEEGRVKVEYRPFELLDSPWPKRATNAFAAVLDDAGADAAKEFHDTLYTEQPTSDALPDDDWLVERAVAAGASEDVVRPAIEDLAYEQWVVNATDAASKAGIRQTPTLIVDGEDIGGDQLEDLVTNFFAAIEDAS